MGGVYNRANVQDGGCPMGLDVGVITISYIERPEKHVNDFLLKVAANAGSEYWGWGSGGKCLRGA